MRARSLCDDMIADFKPQSHSLLEPVIHSAAKMSSVGHAVTEKHGVTTIDEGTTWPDWLAFRK